MDRDRIEKAVREILLAIGENPQREGLLETPKRVADMCAEIFLGISLTPESEIRVFKEEHYGGVIAVKDIPFYSVCEHHLVPFFGKADVVYLPTEGSILGLSKVARIVDLSSKKPQLQERLTDEIANHVIQISAARGVLVRVEAEHLCMTMRGVKKPGTKIITLSSMGAFKTDSALREEAMRCL